MPPAKRIPLTRVSPESCCTVVAPVERSTTAIWLEAPPVTQTCVPSGLSASEYAPPVMAPSVVLIRVKVPVNGLTR